MLYMAPIDTVPEAGGAVVFVDAAGSNPALSSSGTSGGTTFTYSALADQTFIVCVASGTSGFPSTITLNGSAPGSGGVTQLLASEPATGKHFRWYEVTGVVGSSFDIAWSNASSLTYVRAGVFQLVGYDTSAVLDSDTGLTAASGSTTRTLTPDKAANAATLVFGVNYNTVTGAVQEFAAGNIIVMGVIRDDAAQTPTSITLNLTTAQANRGGSAISVARS